MAIRHDVERISLVRSDLISPGTATTADREQAMDPPHTQDNNNNNNTQACDRCPAPCGRGSSVMRETMPHTHRRTSRRQNKVDCLGQARERRSSEVSYGGPMIGRRGPRRIEHAASRAGLLVSSGRCTGRMVSPQAARSNSVVSVHKEAPLPHTAAQWRMDALHPDSLRPQIARRWALHQRRTPEGLSEESNRRSVPGMGIRVGASCLIRARARGFTLHIRLHTLIEFSYIFPLPLPRPFVPPPPRASTYTHRPKIGRAHV